MGLLMSTPFAVLVLSILLTGCVDPAKSLADFEDRVPDAAPASTQGGPLTGDHDITGEFLVGLAASLSPQNPFRFIANVQYDIAGNAGTITSITFAPLDKDTGEVVPPPAGEVLIAANISNTFDLPLSGSIPGEANDVSGSDIVMDALAIGDIISADVFCGTVTGQAMTTIEIDLAGSTFAAQRITPGTRGDALPAVTTVCP